MLEIRTKVVCLLLSLLLLALLAAPMGGLVSLADTAGADARSGLVTDTGHESRPPTAIACNGGSDGQCSG